MDIQNQIVKLITDASSAIGKPMKEGEDFYMVYQPLNHNPLSLPKGMMAVYSFYYQNHFLKIGQANKKTAARYKNHHYKVESCQSNLAKSLVNDPSMSSLVNESNVSDWIKANCERFDVIIDATKHDKMTLNFIEGLLHYYFRPKYEN